MRPRKEDRTQVKEKRMHLRVTESFRQEFKDYCKKNGVKMAETIEKMIREQLSRDMAKGS